MPTDVLTSDEAWTTGRNIKIQENKQDMWQPKGYLEQTPGCCKEKYI